MKKILIYSALACAAFILFNGCSRNSDSSVPAASVETTTADTTEAETTAATTTSAVKNTTATTTKTTEFATETTTESRTYAHRFEMMNTAFKTKSVPQRCYEQYEKDPELINECARKAIEENREMYGTPSYWCVDQETGNIFACVAYNTGVLFLRNYTVYRIDTNTGEVFSCGDMGEVYKDEVPSPNPKLQEAYGLFAVGGKPVFATYDGLFFADEDTDRIEVIDRDYDPQGGDMFIAGDKVFFRVPEWNDDGIYSRMGVFDPNTKSLTLVEEFPDVEKRYAGETLIWFYENSYLSSEGEKGGEQKLIFEWDDMPFRKNDG